MIIKYIFIFIISSQIIFGQKIPDPKTAKKILKEAGITESQAKKFFDGAVKDQNFVPENNNSVTQEQKQNTNLQLQEIYSSEKSLNQLNQNTDNDLNLIEDNFISPDDENSFSDIIDDELSEISILDQSLNNPTNFGYNLFSGNPEIFQQSINESVDPNYLVNPGDEIIVMLWGDAELNQNFTVSRDGYVFIPNVGQVFVNGLTVKKIEEKLFKLLKKVYSTLGSSTFFDISLGAQVLRPLRIIALGEVSQPGAYNVSHSTTLFSSLFYFNGPTTNGSLRNITLIRKGKKIQEIDYYSYLLKGIQKDDIQLQRDDVVFIPIKGKSVTVFGEINRPGIYELKKNEKLKKLIEYSGGTLSTTYLKRVKIDRILSPEIRLEKGIDRTIVDFDLSNDSDLSQFELFDGDIVTFFPISENVQNIVTIEGSISRPGDYEFGNGLNIFKLIEKAGGILNNTYKEKIEIERVNEDNTLSLISLNLDSVLSKDINVPLFSNDKITLFNKSDMSFKTDVSITGHVFNPGNKQFLEDMTVFDLLFEGGGFKDDNHLSNTYFERADLIRINQDNKTSKIIPFRLDSVLAGKGMSNFKLEMGDIVKVYSIEDVKGLRQNTVSISGYVKNPGNYPLYTGLNLYELLFLSGGINDSLWSNRLFKDRVDVIRLDKKLNSKKIINKNIGSIIRNSEDSNINIDLIDGDLVRVYSSELIDKNLIIRIEGAVRNPSSYEFKSKMGVRDLILEAGGLLPDIFSFRVDIARIDPNNDNLENFSEISTFYLKNDLSIFKSGALLNENFSIIELQPYDLVTVRPDPFFKFQKKITVEGFVYYPGEYVIESPKEKISDMIEKAGGLLPEAYPAASRLIRNGDSLNISFEKLIRNPRSRYNIAVLENDILYIGRKSNLVLISGEVNVDGFYQFFSGKTLSDYVKMAGGYTKDADWSQSYVIYPDGTSKRNKLLKSPRIKDGSKIIVPIKPEKPFSFTEYATNVTSIWADFSQAYLLILLAARGN
mgnify:CR=1 FL=1